MGFLDIDRPSRATDPRMGIKFSEEEVRSLSIAVGVLTICFTLVLRYGGVRGLLAGFSGTGAFLDLLLYLFISFMCVLTAFVFHEVGHKIVANHYGYPAAFSYSKNGLMFAAFLSLLGFLVAAPGAVLIYGYPSRKENGIISLAGPLTNLLIALISGTIIVMVLAINLITGLGSIALTILFYITIINLFIGGFNMIPIGPLDGSKILKWNKPVYFGLLAIFVPGIIFTFLFF